MNRFNDLEEFLRSNLKNNVDEYRVKVKLCDQGRLNMFVCTPDDTENTVDFDVVGDTIGLVWYPDKDNPLTLPIIFKAKE
jgi:hypothetical protein